MEHGRHIGRSTKKRKGTVGSSRETPLAYKPPTPGERRRNAAEYAAREIMETDPRARRTRNAIVDAVLQAGQRVLRGGGRRSEIASE
jgi:hypothetical protein